MMTTTAKSTANVRNLGDSTGEHASRTVVGSRTEVRRWVFSAGVALGAPMYALVGCDENGAGVYNTSNQVGNLLVDVDGAQVGLMMKADVDGNWTATMRLRCLAAKATGCGHCGDPMRTCSDCAYLPT